MRRWELVVRILPELIEQVHQHLLLSGQIPAGLAPQQVIGDTDLLFRRQFTVFISIQALYIRMHTASSYSPTVFEWVVGYNPANT
jgi:hypothetical protein